MFALTGCDTVSLLLPLVQKGHTWTGLETTNLSCWASIRFRRTYPSLKKVNLAVELLSGFGEHTHLMKKVNRNHQILKILKRFIQIFVYGMYFLMYILIFTFNCPDTATRGVLWKNALLKVSQYSQENTCAGVSFQENCRSSETATQVFSWEYCEIFINTYFEKHLQKASSDCQKICGKPYTAGPLRATIY